MKILVLTANCNYVNSRIVFAPQKSKHDITFFECKNETFGTRHLGLHSRLKAKIPKMLAWEVFPDYDYYVWMDYSFTIIREDAVDWIVGDGTDLLRLHHHSCRSTILDELNTVEYDMKHGNQYLLDRYNGENMREQVDSYFKKGYVDNKLFECGLFSYSKELVKNSDNNVMKDWFYHNCLWSVQDQLSLPYLLDKHNVKYKVLGVDIFNNGYFRYGF